MTIAAFGLKQRLNVGLIRYLMHCGVLTGRRSVISQQSHHADSQAVPD